MTTFPPPVPVLVPVPPRARRMIAVIRSWQVSVPPQPLNQVNMAQSVEVRRRRRPTIANINTGTQRDRCKGEKRIKGRRAGRERRGTLKSPFSFAERLLIGASFRRGLPDKLAISYNGGAPTRRVALSHHLYVCRPFLLLGECVPRRGRFAAETQERLPDCRRPIHPPQPPLLPAHLTAKSKAPHFGGRGGNATLITPALHSGTGAFIVIRD